MDKKSIIEILNNIAVLLELKGENPFKSRAYTNAARALEMANDDISDLIRSGKIQQVKGIGQAIALKLKTLVETGSLPYYEELKASVPSGLLDLLTI
ncbi:MAG: hypothetical protein JXR46_03020 [Calditrichaceae bacterium]|nr:hypothetical protein [Calditrichaceae bacterium]MBN2707996.1 hypothetical protein [Calditrichaceae bacterium]